MRGAGDHPDRNIARRGDLIGFRGVLGRELAADGRPNLNERSLNEADGGPANFEAGVSPGSDTARGVAHQRVLTHSPVTNATAPSTVIVFL